MQVNLQKINNREFWEKLGEAKKRAYIKIKNALIIFNQELEILGNSTELITGFLKNPIFSNFVVNKYNKKQMLYGKSLFGGNAKQALIFFEKRLTAETSVMLIMSVVLANKKMLAGHPQTFSGRILLVPFYVTFAKAVKKTIFKVVSISRKRAQKFFYKFKKEEKVVTQLMRTHDFTLNPINWQKRSYLHKQNYNFKETKYSIYQHIKNKTLASGHWRGSFFLNASVKINWKTV